MQDQDQEDGDWEDIENDSNSPLGEIADLPSRIATEQAPQFLHRAIRVPEHTNPFAATTTLTAFTEALIQVQQLYHMPIGMGIRQEEWDGGYPEIATIRSGRRGRKELRVELPHDIWYPRAVQWCQALEVFNHTMALCNESM